MDAKLDELVAEVRKSAKYAQVSEPLIREIGAAELRKRASLKEAIKATKNKLHQAGGMFAEEKARYDAWLAAITSAITPTPHPNPLPSFDDRSGGEGAEGAGEGLLREIMSHHASTRERLPILDAFYKTIFAGLPPIHSVLDVACGLNPLAIPWMNLAPAATYHAVDIYADMIRFLGEAMNRLGVQGKAETRDVIHDCPTARVDVALVLKAVSCLEQIDKRAGPILLDTINARHIVVSYPTRTVGGRAIGMRAMYETHFNALVAGRNWPVTRFEFDGELVFRMDRLL
jgi:16S rRNA (guanine(1405)-N(7))-methyltransferase